MIQIGGDSLFKDLSKDRSYAQFCWETRKLPPFYEELPRAIATRGLQDAFLNQFFLFFLGFCAEYILGFLVRGSLCYIRTFWCSLFTYNLWNTLASRIYDSLYYSLWFFFSSIIVKKLWSPTCGRRSNLTEALKSLCSLFVLIVYSHLYYFIDFVFRIN